MPLLPARVHSFGRLGVGRVDHVVLVDRQPADAAEVVDTRATNFPSFVRIWMRWLWRSATISRPCESNSSACGVRNSPGPVPVLPMIRRNLPFLSNTEMRPTRFGIRHVGVALGHVDVAIARIGHDVGRIGQRVGRISPHARLAQRHQDLAVGAELDDDASLVAFAGKLLELVRARRARVGHPHIAVAIDVDAVRPHEHPAAKAPDLLPRLVEMVDRVRLGAETARRRPRRASVGRPHGLAVAVDGHAVGAAPRPSLDVSCAQSRMTRYGLAPLLTG